MIERFKINIITKDRTKYPLQGFASYITIRFKDLKLISEALKVLNEGSALRKNDMVPITSFKLENLFFIKKKKLVKYTYKP